MLLQALFNTQQFLIQFRGPWWICGEFWLQSNVFVM